MLLIGVDDDLLCGVVQYEMSCGSWEARMVRTVGSITKNITGDVEVLQDDQSFYGAELESLESVFDTEAISASILADLVEILLDELLLLHELDIGEGLRSEFDSLIERQSIIIFPFLRRNKDKPG